jgi:polyisoprenoid-binding protein YceI
MRAFLQLGIFLRLACFPVCAQANTRWVYTIDPTQSELVVQLFKAGVGAALAHDHVIRATEYTGEIQGDPSAPPTAEIAVEMRAASLTADEPALRQKYGLTSSLSEQERREIQAAMEAPDQLFISRYPTLRFRSTRVEQQTKGAYLVSGELTIRGVTHVITFPAQVQQREGVLHSWGSFRFKQSLFGYAPYSAFLGAVKNQDEVVLHFDIVATPAAP